ncbi:MAG: flagellar biosynthetic protein FliO [Leptospirales bacterium]
MLGAAVALSGGLPAEPAKSRDPAQTEGARKAAVDAIGQNWVDQIQGRKPGGEAAASNGERLGPAPVESPSTGDDSGQAALAGEQVDQTVEGGPLRLQNPGVAEAAAARPEDAGANTDAPAGETLGVLPRSEGPSLFSVIFRFFGLMALMVGLFYVGMRYLRAKTGAPVMGGGGDLVQVLVSTPLVQGKFLQIVDVAGRLMVLGVSDSGVQMLETIDDGVVADRIRIWQSRRAVSGPLPTSLLDQVQGLFKTADFRFWVSGDERAKRSPGYASFGELLSGQVPATATSAAGGGTASGPGTAPAGRRKRSRSEDLFDDPDQRFDSQYGRGASPGDSSSADAPEESVPDEIALKNLLKQQKRRLSGINRKKGDDSK